MSTPAAFAFKGYTFTNVEMNMGHFSELVPMDLAFSPSGSYDEESGIYNLRFAFVATQGEDTVTIVKIVCEAIFEFKEPVKLSEIPGYFFPNSLAIVFPYIRAFVSSVTLQANMSVPILIPTLNLSELQSTLIENTQLR